MPQAATQLDLNLLRLFAAVLQEGSLTAAGQRLGITQSAVSHSLNRLRRQLADPLFVRTTRGMQPTAYARELSQSILPALALIQEGVEQQARFDPAVSKRVFRVLMTDVVEMLFFPRLMPHLNRVAPGISVRATAMDRSRYREALESGEADLAIGRLPGAQRDFHQQTLLDVPLRCMLRRAHPLVGDRISMKTFLSHPQIVVSEPGQVEGVVRRALGRRAAQRHIALDVTHYLVVPAILANSDFIAVMPAFGGPETLRHYGLKDIPLPFKLPPIQVVQFWHERVHLDAGHQWLRRTIAELFASEKGAQK